MKKNPTPPATDSRPEGEFRPRRKPYLRPRVTERGTLPGVINGFGSVAVEGISGRPHWQ